MWSDLMSLMYDINFQHSLHSRKVGYWINKFPGCRSLVRSSARRNPAQKGACIK